MTARPFEWRQAPARPVIEEAPPAPSLFDLLDGAGFAATLGPSLARLAGCRISARPERADRDGDPATANWLHIAAIPVAGNTAAGIPASLDLLASPALVATLAELLFGGSASAASEARIDALPPGNATWASVALQLSALCAQALHVNGLTLPASAPQPPPRAARGAIARGAALLPFALSVEGACGRLLLADNSCVPPQPETAAPPQPDIRAWRRRAREQAMAIDLPVSLRLEDLRMPLADVSALRPGDVIPISRPRHFAMMVAGRRIGSVAADSIARPAPEEQEHP